MSSFELPLHHISQQLYGVDSKRQLEGLDQISELRNSDLTEYRDRIQAQLPDDKIARFRLDSCSFNYDIDIEIRVILSQYATLVEEKFKISV